MRVLATSQIGSGHWRPLAPIARALVEAGHTVAFATTPLGCAIIAGHGFQTFPVGDDGWQRPRPSGGERLGTGEPEPSNPVTREVFIPAAARRLSALLTLCRSWRPDVVVREQTEFAGWAVAEALGLPHATLQVSAFRGRDRDRRFAPSLAPLRAAVGAVPDPQLDTLYRYLLLAPFPPRHQDPATPLPPTAHHIRHIGFDRLEPPERPPDAGDDEWVTWAERGASRPLIHATLGTAYNRTPGVFAAILDALRDEPLDLIATLNLDQDPATFGPQPPSIRLARYIPQSALLPHCDAVITHGGSGTVRDAISHGLPLVIIPIAADQPDNARRCAILGLARVVGPEARTPAAIRDAMRAVLADGGYRQNAARLRDEMTALPGPEYAVQLLERLAVERRPLLA